MYLTMAYILEKTLIALNKSNYDLENIYLKNGTADRIISVLKKDYVNVR